MTTKTMVDNGESQILMLPTFRRNNPFIQNLLISACLFCNPGLFLAITGLGAGGGRPSSIVMADTSNGVLYGVFVFSALLGGTAINLLGPKMTAMFGVTGYPVYIASLWYFDATGGLWFPVFAGAYLGLTAGCLSTTAKFIGNTYAEEKDKGLWIAIQWCSNACGSMVGAFVAFGLNFHGTGSGVPVSVYIIFIIIQCCSVGFAACLCPPEKLIRPDGTKIAKFDHIPIKDSLNGLIKVLQDWQIIIMLPAFFSVEAFVVLQSSLNAYAYSLRTRSLNNILINLIQFPFALGLAYFVLDNQRLGSRKRRGLIAVSFDAIWITGTYIAQTIWLSSWKFDRAVAGPNIDWTDKAYPGALVIYLCYGAQYGIFQNTVLWILGSLSNDPFTLGTYSSLFVSVLSAGTAVSFGMDASSTPYMTENITWFVFETIAWPILAFTVWKFLNSSNYFKEDGVYAPQYILEKRQLGTWETTKGT